MSLSKIQDFMKNTKGNLIRHFDSIINSCRPRSRIRRLHSTSSNGSSGSTDMESYPVLPGQRGFLIIINNTNNRKGSEKDYDNVHSFFKGTLNYKEKYINNPTLKILKNFLEKITAHLESNANNYFGIFVFIMGHGDKDDQIKIQGGVIPVDDIISYFTNDRLRKFAGKPKSFFIQACRGSTIQDGVETDAINSAVPIDADIFKFYATTPGYTSHRVMTEGSWFIIDLIKVFKKRYRYKPLQIMCTEVNHVVAKRSASVNDKKQMPIIVSTLCKSLYLIYQGK
ncbi:caspase-3-like isoform X2 [Crassostrea virginica]